MKLVKQITAAVTAMAMAASMMSIGASATTTASWTVRYSYGAPTYWNVYQDTDILTPTKTINSFNDSCTLNAPEFNGSHATVTLKAYTGTPSSPNYLYINTYTSNASMHSCNLSSSINNGDNLYIEHTLNVVGYSCSGTGDSYV